MPEVFAPCRVNAGRISWITVAWAMPVTNLHVHHKGRSRVPVLFGLACRVAPGSPGVKRACPVRTGESAKLIGRRSSRLPMEGLSALLAVPCPAAIPGKTRLRRHGCGS